jgi:hypothetical protein
MTQSEIDVRVAAVTGETIAEIEHRGFSIVDFEQVTHDPEPRGPLALNWDTMTPFELKTLI